MRSTTAIDTKAITTVSTSATTIVCLVELFAVAIVDMAILPDS